ncbi:MAG TPA: hypothetical protein PKD31_14360, partial [Blastocatellia bacterium]|nr:hypothetical protein [Blastocatellia bacterium]
IVQAADSLYEFTHCGSGKNIGGNWFAASPTVRYRRSSEHGSTPWRSAFEPQETKCRLQTGRTRHRPPLQTERRGDHRFFKRTAIRANQGRIANSLPSACTKPAVTQLRKVTTLRRQ